MQGTPPIEQVVQFETFNQHFLSEFWLNPLKIIILINIFFYHPLHIQLHILNFLPSNI